MPAYHHQLDVTLSLDLGSRPGTVRATWIAPHKQPFRDEQEGTLSPETEKAMWALVQTARRRSNAATAADFITQCREVGEGLFKQAFPGQIHAAYVEAYALARRDYDGLRIRLQLPPELEHVPFELLYDPTHRLFVAANKFTSLARCTPRPSVVPREAVLPLRCLVVVAEPGNAAQLNVSQELAALRGIFKELETQGLWELKVLSGPDTLEQLRRLTDPSRYHVLHFIGHGDLDPSGKRTCLVFEDSTRRAVRVDPTTLNPVLSGYTNLALLVMNCCLGGRAVDGEPYTSIPHELLSLELGAVVAMQREVGDDAALLFAQELYRSLTAGTPLDKALSDVRLALQAHDRPVVAGDWFNPQLYLRSVTGCLFDLRSSPLRWEAGFQSAMGGEQFSLMLDWLKQAARINDVFYPQRDQIIARSSELAALAIRSHRWPELGDLVEARTELGLPDDRTDSWVRLSSSRRDWDRKIRQPLHKSFASSDPLELGLAADRCDRLVTGIAHDDPQVRQECYGGSHELRDQFWAEDVEELRRLRATLRIAPLRGRKLQLLRVVDQIVRDDGWTDATLLDLTTNLPSLPDDARLAIAKHPLRSAAALTAARNVVAGMQFPELPTLECEAPFWHLLQEDAPLVRWALGDAAIAVADWEAVVRGARHYSKQLAPQHNLALAHLAQAMAAPDDASRRQLIERSLASWASLLGEQMPEVFRYWQGRLNLGRDRIADFRRVLQAAILAAMERVGPTAPRDSASMAVRGLQVLSIQNITPTPSQGDLRAEDSWWGRWLAAESAGMDLLFGCAAEAKLASIPFCGYGAVLQQRLQETLCVSVKAWRAIYESSESDIGAVVSESEEWPKLRSLRAAFSPLRFAWLGQVRDAQPEQIVRALAEATEYVPSHLTHPIFRALDSCGGPASPTHHCGEPIAPLAETAPLYVLSDDPEREFTADWKDLFLRAWLRRAGHSVKSHGPSFSELEAVIEVVESLGVPSSDCHCVVQLQSVVLESLQEPREDDAELLETQLPILQLLSRLGLGADLRQAMARCLLTLAFRLVKTGQRLAAVQAVSQALHWDAGCVEARALLCAALSTDARDAIDSANDSLAGSLLDELQATLDEAHVATTEFLEYAASVRNMRDELAARKGRFRATSETTAVGESTGCSGHAWLEAAVDDGLWRERLEQSDSAKAECRFEQALEWLCDAALLAPSDEIAGEMVSRAFLELSESVDDIEARLKVLEKARLFFAGNPQIETAHSAWRNAADILPQPPNRM